jgi:hypothetical protein
MTDKTIENIWVSVKEAAEITGYTPGWMTKWVRDMFGKPESERSIQVREQSGRYELWLPDLVNFVAEYAASRLNPEAEEIWVNVTEGKDITGYSRDYVWRLAKSNWEMPEAERFIKTRRRSHGYEIWLPDLMAYISKQGYGPYHKSGKK